MQYSIKPSLRRLAILVSYTGNHDDDVSTNHLIEGLVSCDVQVDLLLLEANSAALDKLPAHANLTIQKLRADCAWLAVPEVKRYLQCHPGQMLLAIQSLAVQAASMANLLSGLKGNVVGLLHNTVQLEEACHYRFGRRLRFDLMRLLYRYTTGVITESDKAGRMMQTLARLPETRVKVLANLQTVVTPTHTESTHPRFTAKLQAVERRRRHSAVKRYIQQLTEWQQCGVCSVNSPWHLSA